MGGMCRSSLARVLVGQLAMGKDHMLDAHTICEDSWWVCIKPQSYVLAQCAGKIVLMVAYVSSLARQLVGQLSWWVSRSKRQLVGLYKTTEEARSWCLIWLRRRATNCSLPCK